MKAMVLAAGFGVRLRPLTLTTPKVLVPVEGRPLISYPLRLLARFGFKEVIINLHHLGEKIESSLEDGKAFGIRIRYSREKSLLGTGGGIRQASPLFQGEPVLVLNGDILIDLNLEDFIRFHETQKGIATMALRSLEIPSPFTPLTMNAENHILQIGTYAAQDNFMYTGVQILEPPFYERLPLRESCLIQEGYKPVLQSGGRVYGYPYDGYWNDVGTLDRLKEVDSNLKSGKIALKYQS
ncbi:MAG: nucleotidyltransferase family protein [Deltaproteobacteria bacterium]|nr:nucleotidyltransferase family protein [Deltaproteobacteria bacterium]